MQDTHLYPALSPRGLLLLVVAILPVMIASFIGQLFTAPMIGTWYAQLNKPVFTPPNVVFPLAWTFLYALMAVAFWRILRAKPETGPKSAAIGLFLVQLVANAGWSYAFFGRQSPVAGLVVIGLLLVLIALMMRAFLRIDRAAGFALVPYLAWVSFATVLNATIILINR